MPLILPVTSFNERAKEVFKLTFKIEAPVEKVFMETLEGAY